MPATRKPNSAGDVSDARYASLCCGDVDLTLCCDDHLGEADDLALCWEEGSGEASDLTLCCGDCSTDGDDRALWRGVRSGEAGDGTSGLGDCLRENAGTSLWAGDLDPGCLYCNGDPGDISPCCGEGSGEVSDLKLRAGDCLGKTDDASGEARDLSACCVAGLAGEASLCTGDWSCEAADALRSAHSLIKSENGPCDAGGDCLGGVVATLGEGTGDCGVGEGGDTGLVCSDLGKVGDAKRLGGRGGWDVVERTVWWDSSDAFGVGDLDFMSGVLDFVLNSEDKDKVGGSSDSISAWKFRSSAVSPMISGDLNSDMDRMDSVLSVSFWANDAIIGT